MDGIAMEALIYGERKQAIHVCFLFNLCIKHGYLPRGFMNSEIVPPVKFKSGDLSDVNNYRAIAISPLVCLNYSSMFSCTSAYCK